MRMPPRRHRLRRIVRSGESCAPSFNWDQCSSTRRPIFTFPQKRGEDLALLPHLRNTKIGKGCVLRARRGRRSRRRHRKNVKVDNNISIYAGVVLEGELAPVLWSLVLVATTTTSLIGGSRMNSLETGFIFLVAATALLDAAAIRLLIQWLRNTTPAGEKHG